MDQASRRNKYNPEYYTEKASIVLETVSNSEVESWYSHPCTQALILQLEGDMANIVSMWKDGAYTADTADKTLQTNSKHIGMIQCVEAILDHMRDMRRRDVGEDT